MYKLPHGIEISQKAISESAAEFAEILSYDALQFVKDIAEKFEDRRKELLQARVAKTKRLEAGEKLQFLEETKNIRESDWSIAPLPKDLQMRRAEITGPVDRKMVINALNSGADSYMSDFEDSNAPNWSNQINGQINLRDAIRRKIDFELNGKAYKLNEKTATLLVRPRGWHLEEKNVTLNGKRLSGGLFDFALFFFHNAKELLSRGSGPYFYLPKMESHLEARLWNDVFVFAQQKLGIPNGTIKATVLIETINAAFEMDEILYELKDHSAGLNAGRWDYIFSCIKKFKNNTDFCLANRAQVTMTVPFMRSYALLLLKTCHHRKAPAIGGMSALIPIKSDPEANEKALAGVRADKARDAGDGYDGGWIAHPGLVQLALEEWQKVLGDKPNQIDKQRDDVQVSAADLTNFQPETPITEAGLRYNINVGIHYLGSWLEGNGCVPIHNLMEDAATAEISRSQVWQWIRSEKGKLEDGQKITKDLVKRLIPEELKKVQEITGTSAAYSRAAVIFEQMSTSEDFAEFLTLPLYEEI